MAAWNAATFAGGGDIMRDITSEVAGASPGDAAVWLTYAELGDRLGISPASAKRRANRRKWSKRIGNEGLSLVAVPVEVLEAGSRGRDVAGDDTEDDAGDDPSDYRLLAEYLKTELQEAKATVLTIRADLRTAEREAATARERAARAEGEASVLRQALTQMTADLQAARDAATRLRS